MSSLHQQCTSLYMSRYMPPPFVPEGLMVARMSNLVRVRSEELNSRTLINHICYGLHLHRTHQVQKSIESVFAPACACAKCDDHDPPQCAQSNGIVLPFSLFEGEVEDQANNLVS